MEVKEGDVFEGRTVMAVLGPNCVLRCQCGNDAIVAVKRLTEAKPGKRCQKCSNKAATEHWRDTTACGRKSE